MLVHFMRNAEQTNTTLFIIKGKTVILGHTVVIDAKLQYKQYIKTATKGLIAVMALKRL